MTGLAGENAVSEDGGTEDLAGSASNNGGFEENGEEADLQRKFLIFQATPAWLVSTLVHVIILLILGLVTIADPTQIVNVLSASSTSDDGPEMEEFAIDQIDDSDLSEVEEDTEPVDVSEEMELTETVEVEPMEVATVDLDVADLQSDMAPSAASLQTLASMTAQPMGSRTTDMKKKMLRDYGGTPASEAAVTEALMVLATPNAQRWLDLSA